MRVEEPTELLPPAARRLLGRRTGLVPELYVNLRQRDAPDVALTQPRESSVASLLEDDVSLQSAGKGRTLRSSFMGSVGEVVERYCLCWPGDVREGTHRELSEAGEAVVPLEYLRVYDDDLLAAMGVEQFAADDELGWCAGTNLLTGESVYVPEQLVYLAGVEHDRALPTTSNGAACGPTVRDALLGSLYEVIERDAFMTTWLRQETPASVALDAHPDLAAEKRAHFDNDAVSFELFSFETGLDLPTVGCATVDRRDRAPKFTVCGSAALDPTEAAADALVEGAQVRGYVKEVTARYGDRDLEPSQLDTFDDNLYYYSRLEQFDDVSFLLDGEETTLERKTTAREHRTTVSEETTPDVESPDNATAEFDALLSALADAEVTPIAFDVTTRDVREVGLHVTRVVVPELVPLSLPVMPPTEHPAFDGHDVTGKPHPYP